MKKGYIWPEIGESNCILNDQVIYCFAGNLNLFYTINTETGAVEIIGSLPDEEFDSCSLLSVLFRDNNNLLCIPYTAHNIHIMNLETRLWETIHLNEPKHWGHYYNVCHWRDNYYVFPFAGSDMLCIEKKELRIISRIDIKEQYRKMTGCDYKYFSYSGCHIFQNKVYMMMRDAPMIAEYDLLLDKLALYKLEGESSVYVCLMGHEKEMYVLGDDEKIYLWDAVLHTTKNVIQAKFNESESERFKHQVKLGKYIYLFKYIFSDEYIRIDLEKKQVDVLSIKELCSVEEKMIFLAMDKGKFYFCSDDHVLYRIDFESKEVHILPLVLDQEKMQEHISIHLKELDEKIENPKIEGCCVWTLENFIKKYINTFHYDQNLQKENIGEKIIQMLH